MLKGNLGAKSQTLCANSQQSLGFKPMKCRAKSLLKQTHEAAATVLSCKEGGNPHADRGNELFNIASFQFANKHFDLALLGHVSEKFSQVPAQQSH